MARTAARAPLAVVIIAQQEGTWDVAAIQDYFPQLARPAHSDPIPPLAAT